MALDATKQPLLIPPEFGNYAEEHGIFEMMKRLLIQVLINKPNDPILFISELLELEDDDIPQVLIIGPPVSGKYSLGKMVSQKLRCPHLRSDSLLKPHKEDSQKLTEAKEEAAKYDIDKIPNEVWCDLLKARTAQFDCMRKGWVLTAFPETRQQALSLQMTGILPKHIVLLELDEQVALERAPGKRVDKSTGDVYHTTFDWPSNTDLLFNLTEPENYDDDTLRARFVEYNRNLSGVITCYEPFLKKINADSPKGDLFIQIMEFLNTSPRSAAPHTPKILLLGPIGVGKKLQAARIAAKYNLVNVNCGQLVRQHVEGETKIGMTVRPYVENSQMVPDALVLEIIRQRLTQLDAMSRGWVVHGYPRTLTQGEQLESAGLKPNRVIFMDISLESVFERITLRRTDPITGCKYHLIYDPPREETILNRLQAHPKDNEERVRHHFTRWQIASEEMADFWEERAVHINADSDPQTVFESIESIITRPKLKCLI